MTPEQWISLAASLASLILAVLAIWLSITFYRLSEDSQKRIEGASKDIANSVDRLEKLFDHLYADTFSLMRDTYSDMRRHVFPATTPAADAEAQEAERRVEEIQSKLAADVAELVARGERTAGQVADLRRRIEPVLSQAISETREVDAEARSRALYGTVLRMLRHPANRDGMRADDLVRRLRERGFSVSQVFEVLDQLRLDETITWEPDTDTLGPRTVLRLAETGPSDEAPPRTD